MLTNVRSLRANFSELSIFAASYKPSILFLALTETWIDETVDDSSISLPDYMLFRRDRSVRRGGGVCAYVHASIRAQMVENVDEPPDWCEGLWLYYKTCELLMFLLYLPPNLTSLQQEQITKYILHNIDSLMTLTTARSLIICGDMNTYRTSDLETTLNLIQLVNEGTRGHSTLDKVLFDATHAEYYKNAFIGPNIGTSDHKTVFLWPQVQEEHPCGRYVTVYDYREEHINRFLRGLDDLNWSHMYRLPSDDLDAKCSYFYEKFNNARAFIPSDVVVMKPSDKPWITPLLKKLINQRFRAYRMSNFSLYNHLKIKVKKEIDKAKVLWSRKMCHGKKGIWGIASELQNKRSTQTKMKNFLLDFSSPAEAANMINTVFSEVFSKSSLAYTSPHGGPIPSDCSTWTTDMSPSTVCEMLGKVDCRKAKGSDNIPPILLKFARFHISQPLSHLFTISIEKGYLPSVWKMASVVPVPKRELLPQLTTCDQFPCSR